jgi:hypothetical protein
LDKIPLQDLPSPIFFGPQNSFAATPIMPEPASTAVISTVASTVASFLSLARLIPDIKNTPADVKTCFDLTHRIEADLQTLVNLRARHEKYLLTVPETLKRLDDMSTLPKTVS